MEFLLTSKIRTRCVFLHVLVVSLVFNSWATSLVWGCLFLISKMESDHLCWDPSPKNAEKCSPHPKESYKMSNITSPQRNTNQNHRGMPPTLPMLATSRVTSQNIFQRGCGVCACIHKITNCTWSSTRGKQPETPINEQNCAIHKQKLIRPSKRTIESGGGGADL